MLPPPPAWVQARLLTLTGLRTLDMGDALHADLARAVYELGAGASDGVVLQRLRWHYVQHLRDAGAAFAKAKADFEHAVSRRVVEEMARSREDGRRMSLGWATEIATSEAQSHKLAYLLAEQRERFIRKALDSIASAIELHRTARADERAADRAHAQGMTGGA